MPDASWIIIQMFSNFYFLFLQKKLSPRNENEALLFVLSESEFLSNFT